jgi:NDP-sugar pyrophosphorylase family protein
MVVIAGKPMLWHIMSIFSSQGFNEFVVATGYKGEVIRDWVETVSEPWDIQTLDTGQDTQTGGRIAQCLDAINVDRAFVTYGDGLGNVNLAALLDFHIHQGKLATVTAVRPPARFGVLESKNGLVTKFGEKSVEAFTMFDVNKAIMRCLTKNLAMFGLGLYIYAGEDLPEGYEVPAPPKPKLDAKRFAGAMKSIQNGTYTLEKLREMFELTPEQDKQAEELIESLNAKTEENE